MDRANLVEDDRSVRYFFRKVCHGELMSSQNFETADWNAHSQVSLVGVLADEAADTESVGGLLSKSGRDSIEGLNTSRCNARAGAGCCAASATFSTTVSTTSTSTVASAATTTHHDGKVSIGVGEPSQAASDDATLAFHSHE